MSLRQVYVQKVGVIASFGDACVSVKIDAQLIVVTGRGLAALMVRGTRHKRTTSSMLRFT